MGKLIEAGEQNFEKEILAGGEIVLADFWAPWCGPCKMQTPILEKIAQSELNVTIAKINTDENPALAQKMGISSIPTLILFQSGKEKERFIGVQTEKILREKLLKL